MDKQIGIKKEAPRASSDSAAPFDASFFCWIIILDLNLLLVDKPEKSTVMTINIYIIAIIMRIS